MFGGFLNETHHFSIEKRCKITVWGEVVGIVAIYGEN